MIFNRKQETEPDFELFTIYDAKVGYYRAPVLAVNRHDIMRQLDKLFRDPTQGQNELVTNSEDFQLFKIGTFTKKTGQIVACHPEHVANLHEIRTVVSQDQERMRPVSVPSGPGALSAT